MEQAVFYSLCGPHRAINRKTLQHKINRTRSKDVLLKRLPKGPKKAVFCPWWPFDLWQLTLTFKLVGVRDQTRLPCELAQIRSVVPPRYFIHKKVTDSAKNRTLCRSLHAVKTLKTGLATHTVASHETDCAFLIAMIPTVGRQFDVTCGSHTCRLWEK